MRNLKLQHKILLANIALAILVTVYVLFRYSSSGNTDKEAFAYVFGLACLGIGLVDLFIGVILVMGGDSNEWRSGFLISGGILLLLSGISCGGGLLLS